MSSSNPPTVINDPRFKAARRLVTSGRVEGAVDMFATLVEESITKHGDTSLEAAACFYEYGNALFRAGMASKAAATKDNDNEKDVLAKPEDAKMAAGLAAEKRNQQKQKTEHDDSKPPAAANDDTAEKKKAVEEEAKDEEERVESEEEKGDDDEEEGESAQDEGEDVNLALEMMENCWSILEETTSQHNDEKTDPSDWIKSQLPRVLQGIADVLREIGRTPDAADAYSRALPYREAAVAEYQNECLELPHLKAKRMLAEANVLVAEALLECEDGQDVVTGETGDVLVTAGERVDFARGYYDKARDAMQETVFLMGKIASAGKDLGDEKQDVCFCATLLMGVGETLVAYDEAKEEQDGKPPAKKTKTN